MIIPRWTAACAAAVLALAPQALRAQQTPEAVLRAYYAHFRAGEMGGVASLTHPRAMESFRGTMLGLMAQVGEEAVQEDGMPSLEQMRTLPADSVYRLFMQGAQQEQEEFGELFATLQVEPLGHVLQGDSLAHVVYVARTDFMGHPTQQTMVATLRRHGRGWLIDPGDGLMNMMGGGVMTLVMSAAMQAGMAEGLQNLGDLDVDVDVEINDDDPDADDEDEADSGAGA